MHFCERTSRWPGRSSIFQAMSIPVHVHFLPSSLLPDALPGTVAVAIDILRATSTITTAMANGALRVFPCNTREEALRLSSEQTLLLGGERKGLRIEGFDLGNSPFEYTEDVRGRSIAFTTTNGTRAILAAAKADRILIGSFLNLSAIIECLRSERKPCHLICAGTDGFVTGEDVLFAGAVAHALNNGSSGEVWTLNDAACIALAWWQAGVRNLNGPLDTELCQLFRETRGGQNLIEIGSDRDLEYCSRINLLQTLPELGSDGSIFCRE